MDTLLAASWSPSASRIITENVLNTLLRPSTSVTLFFLECGCGYHEWNVVHALKAANYSINTIVMMDCQIDSEWRGIWLELSKFHDVELVILESYVSLAQWVQFFNEPSAVIYINGALRFSPRYCGITSTECQHAATLFWKWCAENVINQPINFVDTSILKPACANTWGDLVLTFSQ